MSKISARSAVVFATTLSCTTLFTASELRAEEVRTSTSIRHAFVVDPVTDGCVLGATIGFAVLLELILTTGELRPQVPVDAEKLLPIDRLVALSDETNVASTTMSNVLAGTAIAFVLADAGLNVLLDRQDASSTYLMLYAESAMLNLAVGDLAKMAIRRPRPTAYAEVRRTGTLSGDTNAALSFYSGHAALVAGLSATATYLAFARDESGLEGWLTLAGGSALTVLVSVARVRARAHFPTDVLAGVFAGASLGTLVPHLHRADRTSQITIRAMLSPGDRESITGLAIGGAW